MKRIALYDPSELVIARLDDIPNQVSETITSDITIITTQDEVLVRNCKSGNPLLTIMDINGKIIRTESGQTRTNISALSSGLYFLQVSDGDQSKVFRFVK